MKNIDATTVDVYEVKVLPCRPWKNQELRRMRIFRKQKTEVNCRWPLLGKQLIKSSSTQKFIANVNQACIDRRLLDHVLVVRMILIFSF